MSKKEQVLQIDEVKRKLVKTTLVGTSDLILNKLSRSFELQEIWKQSHEKGEKIPAVLDQPHNTWEQLITSIDWEKPITYHDDNWALYTEEEWKDYMTNNAPCINAQHIIGSMKEAFISFGFKDSTGKNGTDFTRSVKLPHNHFPITFTEVEPVQTLVPTNGKNRVNVLSEYNLFHGWKCDIEIFTADVALPTTTVIEMLVTAGQFIGLATQRKNGFGSFTLENLQVTDL